MIRRVFSLTILTGFLIWAGSYVRKNVADFASIGDVHWSEFFLLATAFLVIMVCNGLFISIVTRAFQVHLQILEWLSLSFASSLANYFLPFRGGAGLRAMYMSKLHGFPIAEFVSTLSIMYLMHIVVNGLMALAGMGLIAANDGAGNHTLLAFFLLIALSGILAMLVDINVSTNHKVFPLVQLHGLFSAWKKVRQNRILVLRLWILMLILAMATVWQCRVAFESVSVPISWGGILVYAASKNLATLVSLTPGSLGVVELISIYLGTALNYSTSDALMVQGLIRSVAIITLLLIGPFAFVFLQRRIRKST